MIYNPRLATVPEGEFDQLMDPPAYDALLKTL